LIDFVSVGSTFCAVSQFTDFGIENLIELIKMHKDDRVRWGTSTTDLGTVTATAWSEVTISWDDGEVSSVSHNDMRQVERVPAN
jgi:hypothetical protein